MQPKIPSKKMFCFLFYFLPFFSVVACLQHVIGLTTVSSSLSLSLFLSFSLCLSVSFVLSLSHKLSLCFCLSLPLSLFFSLSPSVTRLTTVCQSVSQSFGLQGGRDVALQGDPAISIIMF
jgi:hypothetical protein